MDKNIHLSYILEIVCAKLQISDSQHTSAEEKYTAVGEWLAAPESPLRNYSPVIFSQGSFRIGTTVKPVKSNEYDIDLVCHFQKDGAIVDPMALLESVYQRIKVNRIYQSIVEKKTRCVRINYKDNFHLDILPARSDPTGAPNYLLIPDRSVKAWMPSNPRDFAKWFQNIAEVPRKLIEKARIEPLPQHEKLDEKLPLQQTVQLLKRWRDIVFTDSEYYPPPSVVLTTLAGAKYNKEPLVVDALTSVMNGIINEMNSSSDKLIVHNPTNPKENLTDKWYKDSRSYPAFFKLFMDFKKQWDDLLQVRSTPEISSRLEKLFGEQVVKIALKEYAQSFNAMRDAGKLGVDKTTGIISALGTGVIPIKKNTFYGKNNKVF